MQAPSPLACFTAVEGVQGGPAAHNRYFGRSRRLVFRMKGNRKLGEPDTEAVKEFLMKSNPLNIESHAYNPGTPCRAVRQGHEGGIEQSRAISMIANPSARVQMAAVRRDRSVICFIENRRKSTADSCQKHRTTSISLLRQVRGYS